MIAKASQTMLQLTGKQSYFYELVISNYMSKNESTTYITNNLIITISLVCTNCIQLYDFAQ